MRRTDFARLPALLLALASIAGAAENCPWLNAATAGGVLGGPVTFTVQRSKSGDDAMCEFVRRDGSLTSELRIETETMLDPAKQFAHYTARCHGPAVALKAVGNEAVACSGEGDSARLAEQVVGRVRDRAFVVQIRTSDRSTTPPALRETVRKVAEQVAGILF